MSMALGATSLVLQLFLVSRGASTLLIGSLSSLNAAGILVGGLVWGTISDRMHRGRLLVFLALALTLVAGVLVALPPSFVALGSSFLQRLLLAGFTTVAVAIVSGASTVRRRGKNVSYIYSASAAGRALGLISIGFLLEQLGFRFSFAFIAALPLIGVLALRRLSDGSHSREHVGHTWSWRQIWADGLGALYLAAGLRQMAVFGTISLLYVYMASIGITPGLMGVVSSLNTFMQIFALVAFGWLADRIGRPRIFIFGFAVSAVTPCLFAVLTSGYGMAISYLAHGLSFSALHVGSTAFIGDRTPPHRQGQMLGLFETSRGLGGLFGPIIAGALVPTVGFSGMFFAMASVGAVGFVVLVWWRVREHRRQMS